jgi:hypothetical protein
VAILGKFFNAMRGEEDLTERDIQKAFRIPIYSNTFWINPIINFAAENIAEEYNLKKIEEK